jgi:hypothetical protein
VYDVDEREQELLRQALETERQKLTDEQRREHDLFCQVLRANETYRDDFALKAAELIRTEQGWRQASELQILAREADRVGAEQNRNAWDLAGKAAIERDREAQDIAKQQEVQARELTAQREITDRAKHEATRLEPIPGSIQNFVDKILAAEQEKQARDLTAQREVTERSKREAAVREPIPGSIQRFVDKIVTAEQDKLARLEQERIENVAKNTREQQPQTARPAEKSDAFLAGKEISEAFAERMGRFLDRLERDERTDRYEVLKQSHIQSGTRKM